MFRYYCIYCHLTLLANLSVTMSFVGTSHSNLERGEPRTSRLEGMKLESKAR